MLPLKHPFNTTWLIPLDSLGELYCFSRTESFLVDLETRIDDVFGKTKFVDITFSYYDGGKITAKGAMELKFKKKSQGADDFVRINSYINIQSLEECLNRGYDVAYFCMVTDNSIYTCESVKGTTGDIFSMRNGYTSKVNLQISNPNCKGRKMLS